MPRFGVERWFEDWGEGCHLLFREGEHDMRAKISQLIILQSRDSRENILKCLLLVALRTVQGRCFVKECGSDLKKLNNNAHIVFVI